VDVTYLARGEIVVTGLGLERNGINLMYPATPPENKEWRISGPSMAELVWKPDRDIYIELSKLNSNGESRMQVEIVLTVFAAGVQQKLRFPKLLQLNPQERSLAQVAG